MAANPFGERVAPENAYEGWQSDDGEVSTFQDVGKMTDSLENVVIQQAVVTLVRHKIACGKPGLSCSLHYRKRSVSLLMFCTIKHDGTFLCPSPIRPEQGGLVKAKR